MVKSEDAFTVVFWKHWKSEKTFFFPLKFGESIYVVSRETTEVLIPWYYFPISTAYLHAFNHWRLLSALCYANPAVNLDQQRFEM